MLAGKSRSLNVGLVALALVVQFQTSLAETPETTKNVADEDEHVCKWPDCLPKCEQCAGERVGHCWLSYASSAFACSTSVVNNSDCFLASCLCKPGFCSKPVGKNLMGKVEYECSPQICENEGGAPRPPPFKPQWWVKLFLIFAPEEKFPAPAWMEEHHNEYVMTIVALPLVLFCIGLVVAVVTAWCLCCGSTGHHFVHGKKYVKKPTGAPQKPATGRLVLLAMIIISVVTFATIKRFIDNQDMVRIIEETLQDVHTDSVQVARQAVRINNTVEDFFDEVGTFVHECSSGEHSAVKPLVKKFAGAIETSLLDYRGMVNNYTLTVLPVPEQVNEKQLWVKDHDTMLSFVPNLPLIFLATVCLIILAEAMVTVYVGTSSCARCVDSGLRMSAVVFVLIILIVAATIAVGSTIGITASHFCMEPDDNAITYVRYFANKTNSTTLEMTIDETTGYYLTGQVLNPIISMSQKARKYIVSIEKVYKLFKPVVDNMEALCTTESGINVTSLATEAYDVLGHAQTLLDGRNVWPFYENAVRKGICTDLTLSLLLMVIFQCIVGLILFPICAVLTHRFLVQWSDYEKWVESQGLEEGSRMLEEEWSEAESE